MVARFRSSSISSKVPYFFQISSYFLIRCLLEYNRKLKYATNLPVVNVGSAKKPNWIPPELCVVEEGNAYRDKLSDKETASMIKYACNIPKVNAEAITQRGFPLLGLGPVKPPTDGFGVTIDTDMCVIPGRELRPPSLTYRAGNARVANGSWNILDVKFHRGAQITSWWVLIVRDNRNTFEGPKDPRLMGLVQGFGNKLRSSGIALPQGLPFLMPPATLANPNNDPGRLQSLSIIRNLIKSNLATRPKPSFILVLLEARDNFIYPGIKVHFRSFVRCFPNAQLSTLI